MKEKRLVKYLNGFAIPIDKSTLATLGITQETKLKIETVDGFIKITPVKEKKELNFELLKERKRIQVKALREFLRSIDIMDETSVSDDKLKLIRKKATEMAYSDSAPLTQYEQGILLEMILDELFGFGPLTPFFNDPQLDNPIEMTLDGSFFANGKRLDVRFDSIKHKIEILERIQKMPQADSDDISIEYKVGGARRIRLPKPEFLV